MNKNWLTETTVDLSPEFRRDIVTVKTNEDWYPTINGELQMSVMRTKWDDPDKPAHWSFIRICIWGGDDFGLEKDYAIDAVTFEEALEEADNIPEPVTREWLQAHGFVPA